MIFKTILAASLVCLVVGNPLEPKEEQQEVQKQILKDLPAGILPEEKPTEILSAPAQPQPVPEVKISPEGIDRKDINRAPEGIDSLGQAPDANPAAPPAESASDLEAANTYWGGWGGYYRRPYYGYGGGWGRGWGGYGGQGGWGGYGSGWGGYGYGRNFGGGWRRSWYW